MKTLFESILSKSKVSSGGVGDAITEEQIFEIYKKLYARKYPRLVDQGRSRLFTVNAGTLTLLKDAGSIIDAVFISDVHDQCGINKIVFDSSAKLQTIYNSISKNTPNDTNITSVEFSVSIPILFRNLSYKRTICTDCAFTNTRPGKATAKNNMFDVSDGNQRFNNCNFNNLSIKTRLIGEHFRRFTHCTFDSSCAFHIDIHSQYVYVNAPELYRFLRKMGIRLSTNSRYDAWRLDSHIDKNITYTELVDRIFPDNNIQDCTIQLGGGAGALIITKNKPSRRKLAEAAADYMDYMPCIQLNDGTWMYKK